MRKFAVLGSPISHSLSPVIHDYINKKLGFEASYEPIEVNGGELANFLHNHRSGGWEGFSLTMPLKDEALQLSKNVDEDAVHSRAVNTLYKSDSGWDGFNTDVFGFRFLFKEMFSRSGRKFSEGQVAILGGGGTARAALVALRGTGARINVYRRDSKRDGDLLTANSAIEIADWSEISDALGSDVLINCAPVNAMNSISLDGEIAGFLFDALYSPWPTPLMKLVQNEHFFSGKDLLVAQALRQVEIFHRTSLDYESTFNEVRKLI